MTKEIKCKYCGGNRIKTHYRPDGKVHYYTCDNDYPCKGRVFSQH